MSVDVEQYAVEGIIVAGEVMARELVPEAELCVGIIAGEFCHDGMRFVSGLTAGGDCRERACAGGDCRDGLVADP